MSLLDQVLNGAPRVRCLECGEASIPRLEDVPTEAGGMTRVMSCQRCGASRPVAVFSPYGVQLAEQVQEAAAKRDAKLVMKLQKKLAKEVRRP